MLAAGALATLLLLPAAWVQRGPNLCLVKALTGVECYGCGMTRAVSLLLHGDAAGAMMYNRGSAVVLPLLVLLALSGLLTGQDAERVREARTALRLVWVVASAVALAVLLMLWVLSPAQIARLAPKCEWKARYGRECFLCGMTTAFIDIREGRWREAQRANAGSVPLYAGVLVNEAGLVLFLRKRRGC